MNKTFSIDNLTEQRLKDLNAELRIPASELIRAAVHMLSKADTVKILAALSEQRIASITRDQRKLLSELKTMDGEA